MISIVWYYIVFYFMLYVFFFFFLNSISIQADVQILIYRLNQRFIILVVLGNKTHNVNHHDTWISKPF